MLGVDAGGSGIFTQTGGVNVPYIADQLSSGTTVNYSYLQLGISSGAYGEYDMSGGSVGVNAIFVGANQLASPSFQAGTGVFNQTGGSIGSLSPSGSGAVGLAVGGNFTGSTYPAGSPFTSSSSGNYTLGTANGIGSPLFVGGCEVVGGSGTGTFTQNCGTNAIVGGAPGFANPTAGGNGNAYNTALGTLILGYYSGQQKNSPGTRLLWQRRGDVQSQRRAFDRRCHRQHGRPGDRRRRRLGILQSIRRNQYCHQRPSMSAGQPTANQLPSICWPESRLRNLHPHGRAIAGPDAPTGYAEFIGDGGTGIFQQNGGTNQTVSISLDGSSRSTRGYPSAATNGTYNLNGGLLQTGDINQYWKGVTGIPTFNFTAGTLQAAAGGLQLLTPITLGGAATLDTNGTSATSVPLPSTV